MAALAQDVATYPDDYQYERAQRFGVSAQGIRHALKRLRLSRKKTLQHPKANAKERENFQATIQAYQAADRPIIYIDESGFAQDMPRLYRYSPKGKRCYGKNDWLAKGRVNIIGALLKGGLITVCAFQGNIDSDIFHAWINQDLLPKVPHNAVIVMDNVSFHKRQDRQHSIKNAGFTLEYLPVYSPALNPIEHKWAQAKAHRRKYRCDIDTLLSSSLF